MSFILCIYLHNLSFWNTGRVYERIQAAVMLEVTDDFVSSVKLPMVPLMVK